MDHFVCTNPNCHFVGRVRATDEGEFHALLGEGSDWYPHGYVCPMCGGVCQHSLLSPVGASPVDLTTQEAFVAFSGGPLPSDKSCTAHAVYARLVQSPVKHMTAHDIGNTGRCVLETLELEDGTILHFAASVYGATVYRVTERDPRHRERA